MTKTILVFCITVFVYTGFLYACKIMWFFYALTPVGERFTKFFAARTNTILDTLDMISIRFSIEIIMIAFIMCLVITAICQLFHITRFLYEPRGLVGRTVLWGLPLTAVVATMVHYTYGGGWRIAYAIAFIPTMCLFSSCFELTSRALLVAKKLFHKQVEEIVNVPEYQGPERRKFPRVKKELEFSYIVVSDINRKVCSKTRLAQTEDISLGGLRFETKEIIVDGLHMSFDTTSKASEGPPIRNRLVLQFQVPGFSNSIEVWGEVAWYEVAEEGPEPTYAVGIEFINVSPENREAIKRLVHG